MSAIIGDNYSLVSLGTLTFMTPLFFTTLSTSKRKRQAFLSRTEDTYDLWETETQSDFIWGQWEGG